jgi:hypothetical protein
MQGAPYNIPKSVRNACNSTNMMDYLSFYVEDSDNHILSQLTRGEMKTHGRVADVQPTHNSGHVAPYLNQVVIADGEVELIRGIPLRSAVCSKQ